MCTPKNKTDNDEKPQQVCGPECHKLGLFSSLGRIPPNPPNTDIPIPRPRCLQSRIYLTMMAGAPAHQGRRKGRNRNRSQITLTMGYCPINMGANLWVGPRSGFSRNAF